MSTKNWNDLEALQPMDQTLNENLLLIDANNLSYRWLQRPNYDSFASEFIRTVQSLSKSYEARTTIVCFDFGKSYYRLNLHEEYKATRKKPTDEEEQKKYDDFFQVLNSLPEMVDDVVFKFRGVEADDIIAYLAENKTQDYNHTWIVSSDRDLYQLINENVSIFNIFGRKEITLEYLQENFGITPSEYMLSRIIEGDKSDNIIGVDGIGPKRAQTLAKEYKCFENLIEALPLSGRAKYIQNLNNSVERLIKNERLINLKKYSLEALKAGKQGEAVLDDLSSL